MQRIRDGRLAFLQRWLQLARQRAQSVLSTANCHTACQTPQCITTITTQHTAHQQHQATATKRSSSGLEAAVPEVVVSPGRGRMRPEGKLSSAHSKRVTNALPLYPKRRDRSSRVHTDEAEVRARGVQGAWLRGEWLVGDGRVRGERTERTALQAQAETRDARREGAPARGGYVITSGLSAVHPAD